MFLNFQPSQLCFHGLMSLATTVAVLAHLTTYTTATDAQSKDLHKLKQQVPVENNKNVVQSRNIRFALQRCQRVAQSKTINCQLLFTATSQERQRITIYGSNKRNSSRVFDLAGNEYIASFAQIGKERSTDNRYNGQVTNYLIPGIPTKVIMNFELPTDVTQLAALEIKYNSNSAVLRDINIVTVKPQNPTNRKR